MKLTIFITFWLVLTFELVTTLSSGKTNPMFEHGTTLKEANFSFLDDLAGTDLSSADVHLVNQLCNEFGVENRLIFALMKQESQFDRYARSERGAIGLMQIMPVTNSEINEKLHIEESTTLRNHLSAGIYYFSKLSELFPNAGPDDRMKLALAAYNAGPSRIYDAQKLAAYLNGDPNSWNSVRNALPLLSKRYYSLHQLVWENGKPESGYFGSSRQTIGFVENVSRFYHSYCDTDIQ